MSRLLDALGVLLLVGVPSALAIAIIVIGTNPAGAR